MAKALRTVAVIAGAVALIGATVLTAGGAAFAATALGGALAGTGGIVAIAGIVGGVASIGATLLQKTPPTRGSITQVTIASDPPQPYLMGESYFGGIVRHDAGYGATLKKVPNPYRGMVIVYSGCGPVEQLVAAQTDFAAIGGYYSGFLSTASQLGATPEAAALVPPLSAPMSGWGATNKLSGQAAILWNFKFDKDGKVFSSGLPVLGAVWKGVKVYDPRLDSTYPGGSGAHRIATESTWTWSDNPALHALAYAYGRRQNGKLVFGVGLSAAAIRLADFVTLANVCAANAWRVSGVIFEPGDRWANLKEILLAGGAEPVFAAGLLSLRIRSPQVALDTITEADLVGEAISVTAMQSYRDRLNTAVVKYREPTQNWELVPTATALAVSTYLAEDGEEMIEEMVFGLVRDANQATQLAAYKLVDSRELFPITVPCGPRLRAYRPGECLHLDLPTLGIDRDAIILTRQIDPATLTVTFTFASEDSAKHAFALGRTGTPPPTPALGQTAAERDTIAAVASGASAGAHLLKSQTLLPLSSTATTIPIAAFDAVLDDGRALSFAAATLTGLTANTTYAVFWNLITSAYLAAVDPAAAQFEDSALVFIGGQTTALSGGGYTPPDPPPDGYGGGGGWYNPIP